MTVFTSNEAFSKGSKICLTYLSGWRCLASLSRLRPEEDRKQTFIIMYITAASLSSSSSLLCTEYRSTNFPHNFQAWGQFVFCDGGEYWNFLIFNKIYPTAVLQKMLICKASVNPLYPSPRIIHCFELHAIVYTLCSFIQHVCVHVMKLWRTCRPLCCCHPEVLNGSLHLIQWSKDQRLKMCAPQKWSQNISPGVPPPPC